MRERESVCVCVCEMFLLDWYALDTSGPIPRRGIQVSIRRGFVNNSCAPFTHSLANRRRWKSLRTSTRYTLTLASQWYWSLGRSSTSITMAMLRYSIAVTIQLSFQCARSKTSRARATCDFQFQLLPLSLCHIESLLLLEDLYLFIIL